MLSLSLAAAIHFLSKRNRNDRKTITIVWSNLFDNSNICLATSSENSPMRWMHYAHTTRALKVNAKKAQITNVGVSIWLSCTSLSLLWSMNSSCWVLRVAINEEYETTRSRLFLHFLTRLSHLWSSLTAYECVFITPLHRSQFSRIRFRDQNEKKEDKFVQLPCVI